MPYLKSYRVLRYDGIGQGKAEKPEGVYHLSRMLEDIKTLFDQLDWPPSHLIGISNGAVVAAQFAVKYGEKVKTLVAADFPDHISPLLKLKLGSWLAANDIGGPMHRFDVATPWVWSESFLQSHADIVDAYRQRAGDYPQHAVYGLIKGSLQHIVDLTRIELPSLLICGEEDILTPPFFMKKMVEKIPGARFEIVKGGHASLLEYPEIFESTIIPFLNCFD